MHTFKKLAFILITTVAFSISYNNLNATNYYASPGGVGTGTFADPCSFTSGINKLTAPGDTLFLRGGIYYQSAKITINKNGLPAARIVIANYAGEKPIIDFSGQPYGSSNPGISLSATSTYLHLKGLIIRYAGDNGIINNGSYHIIENCEFYGNCDTGLQHKSGGNNLILNCDSHNNFDYQSGGTATPNYGGNADGFADKQYSSIDPNTYDGCRAWNNADDGWDFFEKIGSTVIKNSICYRNGPLTYNMLNHPRYLTDKAWFDQFANLSIYPNYGNGNGFKLGGNYTAHNVQVIRCLAVGNRVRGFDQNNNYGKMTLLNASSYQNGYNYGFGTSSGGTLIIKNSVSLSSGSANAFSSNTVTNVNNSWNTAGITVNASDFISLDTSLIITPRSADGSFSTSFMNLAVGSDAIDAGVFVGISYAGNFPDLGYREYGTINQFPPIVTSQNTTQTILLGNPIVTISFSWSGGATGLAIANLPSGLTSTFDNINKTLTIQGIPLASGNYSFTVTSIGGADLPIVIPCNIYVSSASSKRVAYFSLLPLSAADSVIYNKLKVNPDFLIVPVDANITTTDYSVFDAIVMSPVPGSTSVGFAALEAVDKPKLLLKPFTLKSSVWNWINTTNAVNTAQTTVTIIDKTHPIFSGLTFTGANNDELQLFSAVITNAVTGITNSTWLANPSVTVLGNALGSTTTNSVVEIPVGTNMNGTITTQRFVMIGLSEFSLANLTATATQFIENTVYYLLGLGIPVPVPVNFYNVNITENKGLAKLFWKVGVEININKYNIQRSLNGIDFITIASINASGKNEYEWTDNTVLSGPVFYRIVAIEQDGKEINSRVLPFNKQHKNVEIVIAPNPVINKKINLQLKNIEQGKVGIELFDSNCKNVLTTNFVHPGGIGITTIIIPGFCVSGIYTLRLQLLNGDVFNKTVFIR